MIAAAIPACAVAMLLVRLGWGGMRMVGWAGWSLAAVAVAVLAAAAGAWGVAAGCIAAMMTAAALVLHAGWSSPPRARRPARAPASVTLPRIPADLARRMAVFVLVVPVGFVAAQWLAFGMQAALRGMGGGAADATVLALFAQPVAWGGLMAWQMTRADWTRMVAPPVLAAVAGTALWGVS